MPLEVKLWNNSSPSCPKTAAYTKLHEFAQGLAQWSLTVSVGFHSTTFTPPAHPTLPSLCAIGLPAAVSSNCFLFGNCQLCWQWRQERSLTPSALGAFHSGKAGIKATFSFLLIFRLNKAVAPLSNTAYTPVPKNFTSNLLDSFLFAHIPFVLGSQEDTALPVQLYKCWAKWGAPTAWVVPQLIYTTPHRHSTQFLAPH